MDGDEYQGKRLPSADNSGEGGGTLDRGKDWLNSGKTEPIRPIFLTSCISMGRKIQRSADNILLGLDNCSENTFRWII